MLQHPEKYGRVCVVTKFFFPSFQASIGIVIGYILSPFTIVLTLCNWFLVFRVLTEENIYDIQIFRIKDVCKDIFIIWIMSLIGLLTFGLLLLVHIGPDKSQLDSFYLGWVRIIY